MNSIVTDRAFRAPARRFRGRQPASIAFVSLGRRGALCRLTIELARAAIEGETINSAYFVSSGNELIERFRREPVNLYECKTFAGMNPLAMVRNFARMRRQLLDYVRAERPLAVVTLMPHVWTPLLAPAVRRLGALYATVIHDGAAHPGDPTGLVSGWLRRDGIGADLVVTLSQAVAQLLLTDGRIERERILRLFHPDLAFNGPPAARRQPRGPLRVLFLGRIMPYKGLPVLVDAVEMLRRAGVAVELGVVGSGDLGALRPRLEELGAEVINRWVADDEIGPILARYDAMACSHVEASQSGPAAAAFGSAMPVVGMPVGGIAEQVVDGATGVLARRASAPAFAEAVHRLIAEPQLYERISRHLAATAEARSMRRFLAELVAGLSETAEGSRWPVPGPAWPLPATTGAR
jgi:glycosyltransferase involved in cell wall biosynthesis